MSKTVKVAPTIVTPDSALIAAENAAQEKAHPMKDKKFAAYVGTALDFQRAGVEINGLPVDSVALSILSKFGVVKIVGKQDRKPDQRGKASAIYSLQGRPGINVSIPDTPPVQAPKIAPKPVQVEVPKANIQKLQDMAEQMKALSERFLSESQSVSA